MIEKLGGDDRQKALAGLEGRGLKAGRMLTGATPSSGNSSLRISMRPLAG